MADKAAPQKEVKSTDEDVETTKPEEPSSPADDESKSENGDSTENGEPAEKENGEENEKDEKDDTDKVCSIKRKSTGDEVSTDAPTEGASPEKKAKLAETTEAESNGEAEVAA